MVQVQSIHFHLGVNVAGVDEEEEEEQQQQQQEVPAAASPQTIGAETREQAPQRDKEEEERKRAHYAAIWAEADKDKKEKPQRNEKAEKQSGSTAPPATDLTLAKQAEHAKSEGNLLLMDGKIDEAIAKVRHCIFALLTYGCRTIV